MAIRFSLKNIPYHDMVFSMAKNSAINLQKVTVNLPANLLKEATQNTGLGITETLRKSLELLNASAFYEEALMQKGKIKFGISVKNLRED